MNTMIKLLLIGAGLSLTLWAAGCHGPYKPEHDNGIPLEQVEPVLLMDNDLLDDIRVDARTSEVLPDGRLQVYCEIRNREDKNTVVQVQTVFKNERNLAIDDQTNWQTIVIPTGAVQYYRVQSVSTDARRYVIRIKPNRPGTQR